MQQFSRLFALILFFQLLCGLNITFGQLKIFPLQADQPKNSSAHTAASRIKALVPPISLPFWDDFSTPYGNYADTMKWTKSYSVWINDGMAINQPSINVATFDGLDSLGNAYNPNQILVTGYTDRLTSRPINLAEVPVSLRNTVYLSFFYQWQGNGEAPDRDDYLELQFLDSLRQWKTITTIFPDETFDRKVFYESIIAISQGVYFHKLFQFRFRSFGRESGPYDTWNVDYIYLNKNRNANDTSFPDRTIASDATSLLGRYRAVPYRHFKKNMALDTPKFEVKNLKKTESLISVGYNATAEFFNYDNKVKTSYSTKLVASQGIKATTGVMLPLERVTVKLGMLPDITNASQFNPASDSVDLKIKFKLNSGDSLDADRTRFTPINLQINDTMSASYRLRSYYAYDDGVAEFSAGLVEPGSLIAYQFDMKSYDIEGKLIPDTLISFDIYFPPYAITSDQTISFFIYRDDNGKPGEIWQSIPSRRIQRKGLNQFITIDFYPDILINESKFYIGWRHPVAGKALVGLDIDNNTGDKMFVSTNGFWYQNQVVNGSLMIRPHFGKGITEDLIIGTEEESTFSLYPNPNTGKFYVNGEFSALKIYNMAGMEIPFVTETENTRSFIQLHQPPGVYILQFVRNNTTQTRKVIITQ